MNTKNKDMVTTKSEIIELLKDRATALETRAERLTSTEDIELKCELLYAAIHIQTTIGIIHRTVKELKPRIETVDEFIYVTEFSGANLPTKEQVDAAIEQYVITSIDLIADIYSYFLI